MWLVGILAARLQHAPRIQAAAAFREGAVLTDLLPAGDAADDTALIIVRL